MARVTPPSLRDEIDRIAAAVGTSVVHQDPAAPADTRIWAAAGAVVVDSAAALHLARSAPPRRSGVFVVTEGALGADLPDNVVLSAALALGAEAVLALPGQSDELVRVLSLPAGGAPVTGAGGRLVAVAGGRGGAGSSVFASALALSCAESLLIDLDPGGGGIDLVVGAEATAGLRWPEIHVLDGRLSWAAVREALPRHRGVSVLSGSRRAHDVPSAAVESFIEAGRRGGVTVVCDLSRAHTDAARIALCAADLVVVVATCDVRSCAATAALVPVLSAIGPNTGLGVRGPAPGGLRSEEFATAVGLPLLTTMRPEPMLAARLERGGLVLRPRSALGHAARQVLDVLNRGPQATIGRAA